MRATSDPESFARKLGSPTCLARLLVTEVAHANDKDTDNFLVKQYMLN
jgi:hypothetical protein